MADPLAITGAGVVSAAGVDRAALAGALDAGRCCRRALPESVARGTGVDTAFAVDDAGLGLVPDSPDRGREFALRAAREALVDAGALDRDRVGLALGTALGAGERVLALYQETLYEKTLSEKTLSEKTLHEVRTDGAPTDRERALMRGIAPAELTDELARELPLGGPRHTRSVTCASALYALEAARQDLARGRADAMLVGGVDTLSRVMHAGFSALGALAAGGAAGITLGEAAALCLVEPADRARARGARILASIDGQGLCSDGTHLTSPDTSGAGMIRAVREALAAAGLTPSEVARVSLTAADGPAYAGLYERTLSAVFGDAAPPTVSWEACVGHVLAASGAMGWIHAALRPAAGPMLALTVGFGGQNGATVLRPA